MIGGQRLSMKTRLKVVGKMDNQYKTADNQNTYLRSIEGMFYAVIEGVTPEQFAEDILPEYRCELHSCYENDPWYESKKGLLKDFVVVDKSELPR